MQEPQLVPATVLTGFLGAGKTTLLNQLLTQKHGYKCAIIINEFGPVSIDNQLVIGVDEDIVELNNGCLCCRVRDDLVRSLEELFRKQKRFDYILIETTGLADPSPIAHTFRASRLAQRVRLDGIVTVVDARHIEKELADAPEPQNQIAFADVILLNKVDLVTAEQADRVETHLRSINIMARIYRTQQGRIDVAKLLNVRARELDAPLEVHADLREHEHAHDAEDHPHDHDHDHSHEHESEEEPPHHHDDEVRSVYLTDDRPLDLKAVEAWLSEVVRASGPDIYRAKGILYLKGQGKRVVFQGVQMMFDARPDRLWNVGEKKTNQLVFIGRKLDEAILRAGFERCIAA